MLPYHGLENFSLISERSKCFLQKFFFCSVILCGSSYSKSMKFFNTEHNRNVFIYNPNTKMFSCALVVQFFHTTKTCICTIHTIQTVCNNNEMNLNPRVTNLFIGWNSISVVVVCSIGSVGLFFG